MILCILEGVVRRIPIRNDSLCQSVLDVRHGTTCRYINTGWRGRDGDRLSGRLRW